METFSYIRKFEHIVDTRVHGERRMLDGYLPFRSVLEHHTMD
jgi:hypothetical protein